MNGSEILVKTAAKAGVKYCFSNPGTTEIAVVSALDSVPGIKGVLGLFEGACTGAADGYGRMTGKPAMTLLHLGPGMGYGLPNLHNARKAHTPVLNVIGEHASWHRSADSPITMDIDGLSNTVSGWQRTINSAESISRDTADAIAASLNGNVASLIFPTDFQFAEYSDDLIAEPQIAYSPVDAESIEKAVVQLTSKEECALFLGGQALLERGIMAAARIKSKTDCDLISECFPSRIERGRGLPLIDRIAYFPEMAIEMMAKYKTVIFIGADEPVSFFGYEGGPSRILNEDQRKLHIGTGDQDVYEVLEALADAVGAPGNVNDNSYDGYVKPALPQGELNVENAGIIISALQPENAIIIDEAITSSVGFYLQPPNPSPHTILSLTGGSLGVGIPCAIGAALACPDRPVIGFQGDGAAMYTIQGLWTQAREGLNITTLICANRSYDIIKWEVARSGNIEPGPNAQSLTDITNPEVNYVSISKGLGVPAVSVNTAESLIEEFNRAINEPGPHLIEMVL
ncbi:MAG: acetolactate synthase large subunit [Desulfobacterales bacterium]|jgi:acetolactate synthase I/II/III large subunit|nr:acetolactate synthase large subunit [Desulfobacteraceae bacterium]MBT4363632.1 acetolactate synthase large subunit [Desulfobacteraceae bacterium]MBT7084601.1 acetolactate synthase large subunit [Desulfobacterales bacterium]MBT7697671.1 acetolactate synthase large subunit [Desulfobacterales bacterium]